MKKKLVLIIIEIIIILFFGITRIWIDMNKAIPSSILIGVDEHKIRNYIISLYEYNNEDTGNVKTFVAIKNLKTEINNIINDTKTENYESYIHINTIL